MPEPPALSVPARVTLTSEVNQPLAPFGAAGAVVAVVVGAVVSAPGRAVVRGDPEVVDVRDRRLPLDGKAPPAGQLSCAMRPIREPAASRRAPPLGLRSRTPLTPGKSTQSALPRSRRSDDLVLRLDACWRRRRAV